MWLANESDIYQNINNYILVLLYIYMYYHYYTCIMTRIIILHKFICVICINYLNYILYYVLNCCIGLSRYHIQKTFNDKITKYKYFIIGMQK